MSVQSRAVQLAAADPEGRIHHSHPLANQRHGDRLKRKVRAQALAEAIAEAGVFPDLAFFASDSTVVGEYLVHTCIGIEASVLSAAPSLDDEVVDRFHVGRSLQHEVISECLRRADAALYVPDAGSDIYPIAAYAEDIVKSAAIRLARGSAFRVAGMPAELFHAVSALSSLAYERADPAGRLIVVKKEVAVSNSRVLFRRPVSLHSPRLMRKLLEITDSDVALLADETSVYGAGNVPTGTPSLEISVNGRANWDLAVGGKCLMKVAYGHASIPTSIIPISKFVDNAIRTVGPLDIPKVWSIVQRAQECGHGTTLVVCRNPSEEVRRLGGEAVAITPTELEPTDIGRLCKIDGALIIGPDGRCHAFGAILDGVASGRGDKARGSRFNSAVRYHASSSPNSLLVVISDDGTVDLVPSLRRRVSRDEVEAAVATFCDRCNDIPVEGEEFARAHDRVVALTFYLNEDQCQRVSKAYASEMQKRLSQGGLALTIPALSPDPDMNESYFN